MRGAASRVSLHKPMASSTGLAQADQVADIGQPLEAVPSSPLSAIALDCLGSAIYAQPGVHASEVSFVINETFHEMESSRLEGWSQYLVLAASEFYQ